MTAFNVKAIIQRKISFLRSCPNFSTSEARMHKVEVLEEICGAIKDMPEIKYKEPTKEQRQAVAHILSFFYGKDTLTQMEFPFAKECTKEPTYA